MGGPRSQPLSLELSAAFLVPVLWHGSLVTAPQARLWTMQDPLLGLSKQSFPRLPGLGWFHESQTHRRRWREVGTEVPMQLRASLQNLLPAFPIIASHSSPTHRGGAQALV